QKEQQELQAQLAAAQAAMEEAASKYSQVVLASQILEPPIGSLDSAIPQEPQEIMAKVGDLLAQATTTMDPDQKQEILRNMAALLQLGTDHKRRRRQGPVDGQPAPSDPDRYMEGSDSLWLQGPPQHWLQFKVDWLTAGWQPVIANARCNETGGTTRGVALAFRKHLSRLDAPGNHDHRWTASIFQAKNTEMLLVILYLQVGEGPTGYTNRQVLTEVGALILTLNIPYIVMGDFNCEPEELLETTWLRRIKGNILATPDATISSGSVLDYAILSHSLWGRMELEVQHDVPWGPHYGLLGTLHLDGPLLQPCEMLED
ncbi:unnamed protein product, partial [Durusdinium trenchii]